MKNLQEQMAGMKIGKSAAKTKPYNKPEQALDTNGIQPKVSVKTTTSCSDVGCGHKRKHDHDMKKPPMVLTDNGEPQRDGGGTAGRHCDCVSCEVFGASNMQAHVHKANETRERLRTRLSQRKEGTKVLNGTLIDKVSKFAALKRDSDDTRVPRVPEVFHPSVALPVSSSEQLKRPSAPLTKAANLPKPVPLLQVKADVPLNRSQSISSVQTSSLSENGESRDINDLVNFIEGKKAADKEALAKKKAEKKARQKQKKAEEREKVEEEKRRQERERLLQEKRKEEERLKAEALAKKILEQQRRKEEEAKNGKKNKKKGKSGGGSQDVTQETIPAMVTITRARDNANAPPTITITLKSNTSDHEQLISSLVGSSNPTPVAPQPQQQNNKKKKKQPQQQNSSTTTTTTGEVRLKIAVEGEKKNRPVKLPKQPVSIPALRLPPGITITKIEGPPVARCIPGSRAGFTTTVIDTEKIQASSTDSSGGKKSRKRNKKKNQVSDDVCPPSMVTLKNPIFHTLQSTVANKNAKNSKEIPVFPSSQQASFFKNENGIVTIRNPRLQNPLENGSLLSNFLADLKLEEEGNANSSATSCVNSNTNFNAQQILSGLPGIEITKVDKKMARGSLDNNQSAEVSIIPTGSKAGGAGSCARLEWPLENVFAPRGDVADDDMDAEEREIEAFKRFCQQSVPPEQKEKVAHLNVRDIVLRKKDVSN